MNKRIVFRVLGRIMMTGAVMMLLPMAVAFIYREKPLDFYAFLVPILLMAGIGALFNHLFRGQGTIYTREGMVIVALSWIVLSFFGCLPFVISGAIPHFVDAFFETVSGFTTTGASILTDVESMNRSMLFWRSYTHLIGGMGILVFALALLPRASRESAQIMKAEVPGPSFGKIVSKISYTARILYLLYLAFTLILILFLYAGGMPLYDACLHAFGTAGTGGFGIKAASVGYYQSSYLYYVLAIGMIVFGVNFNIYYYAILRHMKSAFQSEELRVYLGIILGVTALIFFNVLHLYKHAATAFRDVFFTVSSIITTTGFTVTDYNTWPLFSKVLIVMLMFIGGCAGSTAGGIKVSRIIICFKSAVHEVRNIVNPHRVHALKVEKKVVDRTMLKSVLNYILVFILIFFFVFLIVSISMDDYISAFSAVATTINNVGPGLGEVGPSGNFAGLTDLNKVLLSITMLIGRLEIFPVIILFSPNNWKKA